MVISVVLPKRDKPVMAANVETSTPRISWSRRSLPTELLVSKFKKSVEIVLWSPCDSSPLHARRTFNKPIESLTLLVSVTSYYNGIPGNRWMWPNLKLPITLLKFKFDERDLEIARQKSSISPAKEWILTFWRMNNFLNARHHCLNSRKQVM